MKTRLSNRQCRIAFAFLATTLSFILLSALVFAASRDRDYDQWLLTAPLPEARVWPRAIITGTTLYVVGGKPSHLHNSFVVSAALSTDPPITQWHSVVLTNSPPMSLSLHATAQTHKNLYIIGGWDGERRYSNIWNYKLDDLGAGYPPPKTPLLPSPDFPMKVVLHDALVITTSDHITGNHIYVFGGVNENNVPQNAVYKAKVVDANGTLGNWSKAAWLPFSLFRTSVVYHPKNRYVYVTGGFDGQNIRPEIHRAKVNMDGSIVAWEKENNRHMPKPLYYHDTIIHNNRLYIFGGQDDEKAYRKVYSAEINTEDGSLGEWEGEKEIPTSLSKHAVVNYEGLFYIIGGEHEEIAQSQLYYSATNTPEPPSTGNIDRAENDDDVKDIVGGATPINRELQLEATPTPSPGLASLSLVSNHSDALEIGGELTYQINFQNGPYPLDDMTFSSAIPHEMILLPAHFQLASGLELYFSGIESTDAITWTYSGELAPHQNGSFSFRVKRTVSNLEHITHPGLDATWLHNGQPGTTQSNPTFNPAEKIYVPASVSSH